MGIQTWVWSDDLGNWLYSTIDSRYGNDWNTDHYVENPRIARSHGDWRPGSPGPDWAPQDWLDEHPGWTPVYHEEAYIHANNKFAGRWVWQPPTPEPLSDNGHWEWHWVDGDSTYSPGWASVPYDFYSEKDVPQGSGQWEWRWVED